MALIEIHDSETHWTSTLDVANEIHDPIYYSDVYDLPAQGCDPQRVRQILRAGFKFSFPVTSELIF